MARFIKLLSRLENRSGKKWLDFYEDNRYSTPSYYYTKYNGGKSLGTDKVAAATEVVKVAQQIGGLKLVDISEIKE
jgi:hypothetical protein